VAVKLKRNSLVMTTQRREALRLNANHAGLNVLTPRYIKVMNGWMMWQQETGTSARIRATDNTTKL
jgi:hypothetical protein